MQTNSNNNSLVAEKNSQTKLSEILINFKKSLDNSDFSAASNRFNAALLFLEKTAKSDLVELQRYLIEFLTLAHQWLRKTFVTLSQPNVNYFDTIYFQLVRRLPILWRSGAETAIELLKCDFYFEVAKSYLQHDFIDPALPWLIKGLQTVEENGKQAIFVNWQKVFSYYIDVCLRIVKWDAQVVSPPLPVRTTPFPVYRLLRYLQENCFTADAAMAFVEKDLPSLRSYFLQIGLSSCFEAIINYLSELQSSHTPLQEKLADDVANFDDCKKLYQAHSVISDWQFEMLAMPIWKKARELLSVKRQQLQAKTITVEQYQQAFKKILGDLLEYIENTLGKPPGDYTVLGLGSLARGDFTPGSDVEIAILVAEPALRSHAYFQAIVQIVHHYLKTLLMVDMLADAKNPQLIFMGHEIDSLTQLFMDHQTVNVDCLPALINTPVQLAEWVVEALAIEDYPKKLYPYSLLNAIFIYSSSHSIEQYLLYQYHLVNNLNKKSLEKAIVNREFIATLLLKEHHELYNTRQDLNDASVIDLKETYLKPLTLWCLDMNLSCELEAMPAAMPHVIEHLAKSQRITPFFARELTRIWDFIRQLRHTKYLEVTHPGKSQVVKLPDTDDMATDRYQLLVNEEIPQLTDTEYRQLQLFQQFIIKPLYQDGYCQLANHSCYEHPLMVLLTSVSAETMKREWLQELVHYLADSTATLAEHVHIFQLIPEPHRKAYFLLLRDKITTHHQAEAILQALAFIPNSNGYSQSEWLLEEQFQQQLQAIFMKKEALNISNQPNGIQVLLELPGQPPQLVNPTVIDQCIDRSTGRIKKYYSYGRHRVAPINWQGSRLHITEKPGLPMMEYAVYLLKQRLVGFGAPISTVGRLTVSGAKLKALSYPVLLTQTVGNLDDNLHYWPDEKLNTFRLSRYAFTKLLLAEMLLRPGDGTFLNHQQQVYPLFYDDRFEDHDIICSIDNDQYFVEPLVYGKNKLKELQCRHLLFCASQMEDALDPHALKEFAAIDPKACLNDWLDTVGNRQQGYIDLFKQAKELAQHYQEDQDKNRFTPYWLLRKGTLSQLGLDFIFLQGQARYSVTHKAPMSGIALLTRWNKRIGSYYQQVLMPGVSLKQRLEQAAQQALISYSTSDAINASLGRVPTLEEIQSQQQFNPITQRNELSILEENWQDFEGLQTGITGEVETGLSLNQNFQQHPDLSQQTRMLWRMNNHRYSHLSLVNCQSLDNETLLGILSESQDTLAYLDIRYCPKITEEAIRQIAEFYPKLKVLKLSGNSGIKEITGKKVSFFGTEREMLAFPQLEELSISHCQQVKVIKVAAPYLYLIKAHDCPQLNTLFNKYNAKEIAQAFNKRGNEQYALTHYEAALKEYDAAIALNPQEALYYNNRGYTYYELNNYEAALKEYDAAIALNPQEAVIYSNRGYVYSALKHYEAALKDYTTAIGLNPQDAITYSNRGDAYFNLKHYKAALKDYTAAIGLNPQDASYFSRRGNAYTGLNNYEAALKEYDAAVGLNPQQADYYNRRGNAYFNLKHYEAALKDYDAAIGLNPQDAVYYYNRGSSYYELKHYEAALKEYDTAIGLNPQKADYFTNRGNAKFMLDDFVASLADFSHTLMLKPDYAYALKGLAYTYLFQLNFTQANTTWMQLLNLKQIDPDTVRMQWYAELGLALQKWIANNSSQMLPHHFWDIYQKLEFSFRKTYMTCELVAHVFVHVVKQAVTITPISLKTAYMEVYAMLHRVVNDCPQENLPYYYLAELDLFIGDVASAKINLQTCLSRNPHFEKAKQLLENYEAAPPLLKAIVKENHESVDDAKKADVLTNVSLENYQHVGLFNQGAVNDRDEKQKEDDQTVMDKLPKLMR